MFGEELTPLLSKLKQFLERHYKIIMLSLALLTAINFAPNWATKTYTLLTEGDVTVMAYSVSDMKDLLVQIRTHYKTKVLDIISDKDKLAKAVEGFKKESNSDANLDFLDDNSWNEFFRFLVNRVSIDCFSGEDLLLLEIINHKKTPIKKVLIRVPSVWNVSKVKVISTCLRPEEISKLETTYSFNKDSKVLFFPEIKELPPTEPLDIYVFGFQVYSHALEKLHVSYDGGVAKQVVTFREYPGIYEIRSGWFALPSWDRVIASLVLIGVFYIVIQMRQRCRSN